MRRQCRRALEEARIPDRLPTGDGQGSRAGKGQPLQMVMRRLVSRKGHWGPAVLRRHTRNALESSGASSDRPGVPFNQLRGAVRTGETARAKFA